MCKGRSNSDKTEVKWYKKIIPHTQLGNTIMWAIILILVISTITILNTDAMDYIIKVIETIKG